MTGNDIVDLESAQFPCGARGARFLHKILTGGEQEIINTGRVGVWALWAMKEAVYKAHHRRFRLPRRFDPKSIEVSIPEASDKLIFVNAKYQDFSYTGTGIMTTEYVHFTATCIPQKKVYTEIFASTRDIKTHLKQAVSQKLGLNIDRLEIQKDHNSIPHLNYQNIDLNLPFSISHHGKFSAFSFQLMNY